MKIAAVVLAASLQFGAAAPPHGHVEGTGSSWSANAVNQWVADVVSQGLDVVYTAPGSAQGRKDFAYNTVDFAVTDIAYQGRDSHTGESDTAQGRPFAYVPVVAGGTAFPYHIKVAGKMIKDLRLSGETLVKIFTNKIRFWNDPAITADNNGRVLPKLKIIPVLHSEGSGSTAQLTAYFAKEYKAIWGEFNRDYGGAVMTEYFRREGGSNAVAQNGSDQVMNYIVSSIGNGSIGYAEYSYAKLLNNHPVAKLKNKAGYFNLPDEYNVAKSLTQAVIDSNPNSPTYLMQNLDKVYVYDDPRTYPLSSYSYMILPTGTNAQDRKLTTPKRQTLVDFVYYSICQGQRDMGRTGYSSLPLNLVKAGFAQLQKLKTADSGVVLEQRDVSTCDNPTFDRNNPDRNRLAEIAPMPPACDKVGAGPCGTDVARPQPGASGGTPVPGASVGPGTTGGPQIDPDTGQVIPQAGGGTTTLAAGGRESDFSVPLVIIVGLELLALFIIPSLMRRRGSS